MLQTLLLHCLFCFINVFVLKNKFTVESCVSMCCLNGFGVWVEGLGFGEWDLGGVVKETHLYGKRDLSI